MKKYIITILSLLFLVPRTFGSCSVIVQSSVETCPSACNGWITFTATTPAVAFNVVLNNDTLPFTDSLRVDGLCVGNYFYWISDSSKTCADSGKVVLQERGTLSVSFTEETCNSSCDATVSFSLPFTGAAHSIFFNGLVNYFQDSLSFTGLCPGTYSYVVNTVGLNCPDTGSVTLTDHIPLNVTLNPYVYHSGFNIQCNGDQSGSVTTQVTGGDPPYSFLWSSGDQSQDLLGITAGSYDVLVTDIFGCSVRDSVTLYEPPTLDPFTSGTYFSVTNVSCFGGSDGELMVNVFGGTPPYSYSWTTGDNTEVITNQPAGFYSVLIWDDSGCLTSADATISQPGPLLLTTFTTPSDCRVPDGTATASAIGGTPSLNGYSYYWSPTGDTAATLTAVSGGNYVLTVTDANGCTRSEAVIVPFISQPELQTNVVSNVPCAGDSDGVASVNILSGLSPFSYTWNTVPPQLSDTAILLSAGSYSIAVTDSNGCTTIDSVTITEPPALSMIASALSTLRCAPDSDGTAAVMVIDGGVAPYGYQWFPYGGTDSLALGLAYGNYSVVATDAQGCTITAPVLIDAPPPLVMSGLVGNVRCNGNADGIISLNVTGGIGDYAYTWTPAVFGTFYVTDLDTGIYSVQVADSNGCVVSDTFLVVEPLPLSLLVTAQPASCFQSIDGSAQVIVAGGTPTYSYQWPTTSSVDSIAANLPAGSHTVIVTDLNGCIDSAVAIVDEPPAILLDIATVPPSSPGCNDGLLQALATEGAAPYSYSWDGLQNNQRLEEPVSGMHIICVQDSRGCHSCDSVNWTDSSYYSITGFVFLDNNQNGTHDRGEVGLPGFQVVINPIGRLVSSGHDGRWVDNTLPDGNYSLVFDTSATNWRLTVPSIQSFAVTNGRGRAPDFGLVPVSRCPLAEVSVFSEELFACDTSQPVTVMICNDLQATAAVTQSYVILEADPALTLQSADYPVIYISPGVYRVETGDVFPGDCKRVNLLFNVACSVQNAQTLCLRATLYPWDQCNLYSAATTSPWDSSFLSVMGQCINDTSVFVIKNNGRSQQVATAVRYFVDGIIAAIDSVQLLAGDSLIRSYFSNGHTVRLEVDQHPAIPFASHPQAVLELCGSLQNWLPGQVSIQYYDDSHPLISQYCIPVNQPWTPNEKTGYPFGVTRDRFIDPGQQLRYTITFENATGDTTDLLVVRDTLDANLDITTVRPGVASHPYLFRVCGQRVLEWYFPNVHFPDNLADPSASRGFVTYTVDQVSGLADYTTINNTAYIYHDTSFAVTTNTTLHTIHRQELLMTNMFDVAALDNQMSLYPNPATGLFYIQAETSESPVIIEVRDLTGRLVYEKSLSKLSGSWPVSAADWSPGQYMVLLRSERHCHRSSLVVH